MSKVPLQRTPEYQCWNSLRDRCRNPNSFHWSRYGGRGIRMCERWKVFENFLADMGLRPAGQFSIDRIDNNGNYEPGNCRWATRTEQNLNRSITLFVERDGVRMTLMECAARLGIKRDSLARRLARGRVEGITRVR